MEKREKKYIILMSLLLAILIAAVGFWPLIRIELKNLFASEPYESFFSELLTTARAGEFSRLNADGVYESIQLGPETDNITVNFYHFTRTANYLPDASRDEIEEPVLYRIIAYENAYYDAAEVSTVYLWKHSPYVTIEMTETYMILTEGRTAYPNDLHYTDVYKEPPVVEVYDCTPIPENTTYYQEVTIPLERCDYLYTLYAEITPDYRFVSVL